METARTEELTLRSTALHAPHCLRPIFWNQTLANPDLLSRPSIVPLSVEEKSTLHTLAEPIRASRLTRRQYRQALWASITSSLMIASVATWSWGGGLQSQVAVAFANPSLLPFLLMVIWISAILSGIYARRVAFWIHVYRGYMRTAQTLYPREHIKVVQTVDGGWGLYRFTDKTRLMTNGEQITDSLVYKRGQESSRLGVFLSAALFPIAFYYGIYTVRLGSVQANIPFALCGFLLIAVGQFFWSLLFANLLISFEKGAPVQPQDIVMDPVVRPSHYWSELEHPIILSAEKDTDNPQEIHIRLRIPAGYDRIGILFQLKSVMSNKGWSTAGYRQRSTPDGLIMDYQLTAGLHSSNLETLQTAIVHVALEPGDSFPKDSPRDAYCLNFHLLKTTGSFSIFLKTLVHHGISIDAADLVHDPSDPSYGWAEFWISAPKGTRTKSVEQWISGAFSSYAELGSPWIKDIEISTSHISEASAARAFHSLIEFYKGQPGVDESLLNQPWVYLGKSPGEVDENIFIPNVLAANSLLNIVQPNQYVTISYLPFTMYWPPAAIQGRKMDETIPGAIHPGEAAIELLSLGERYPPAIIVMLLHDTVEDSWKQVRDEFKDFAHLDRSERGLTKNVEWNVAIAKLAIALRQVKPEAADELIQKYNFFVFRPTGMMSDEFKLFLPVLHEAVNQLLFARIRQNIKHYPNKVIDDIQWLSITADYDSYAQSLLDRGLVYLFGIKLLEQSRNFLTIFDVKDEPGFPEKIIGKAVRFLLPLITAVPAASRSVAFNNIIRVFLKRLIQAAIELENPITAYYEIERKTGRMLEKDPAAVPGKIQKSITDFLSWANREENRHLIPNDDQIGAGSLERFKTQLIQLNKLVSQPVTTHNHHPYETLLETNG